MVDQVYIIHSVDIVTPLAATMSFAGGYFFKGIIAAILGEYVFKPLARRLKAKADTWEHTHPHLIHALENHRGIRPSKCHKCKIN